MTEAELDKAGLTTTRASTKDPRWIRYFVIRADGCTIGRLSFHDGKLYSANWYKSDMYRTEFDESDWEQAKLERYLATHSRLTREEYDAAVKLATVDAAVDKALKLEARKSMPSKSRPAIQGWDPRLLLHRRMRE